MPETLALAETDQGMLVDFVRAHAHLAEPIVFVLGFAEGIPLLSLAVPSSAIFLGLGSVHAATGGLFAPVWLAATLGAILGDIVTYSFGRALEARAESIWPISRNPELLVRARGAFERWGIAAVVGGKFIGPLRALIPIAAGMSRMPLPMFLAASVVSSAMWSGVFLGPGWGLAMVWR